jgi:LmbE family N-acetylglucosaminyl deacetylase
MLPAGDWLRLAERDLPLAADPAALLGPEDGALVIAPHPDDESLGCGGLLAACAEAGRPARVVVVSDGAGSHPHSRAYPHDRLVALRQAEARAAVGEFGLDPARDIAFLGLPDTAVPDTGAAFAVAVEAVVAMAGPGFAIFAPWRHDPHRDHTASFAIAAAVVRALPPRTRFFAYPVWGLAYAHPIPGFPLPPAPLLLTPPRGLRLDVARHLPAKRRAVAAHASQVSGLIQDDPGGFRLPEAALALAFRPFELYLEESAA